MPWPVLFPEAADELSDQWSGDDDQELPDDQVVDENEIEDDRWGATS